jgi:uncharacterized membrane protein (DUF373 family)
MIMLKWIEKIQDIILYILAVLSVLLLSVVTVQTAYTFYRVIVVDTATLTNGDSIFTLLGSFLTVLIIIELNENILSYLQDHVLNVEVAVTTALIAIARKIIIFDYEDSSPEKLVALAFASLSLAVAYYLLQKIRIERLGKILKPVSNLNSIFNPKK